MESNKVLKNARARRMLIMVDEQVSTPDERANLKSTILDSRVEVSMSSVTNEIQGLGDLLNRTNCENIEEIVPVEASTSSACYNLRELPKTTVYVENYTESDDAIFSSDHSEYIPSPEKNGRFDTPSSISGLSVSSRCFDIDTINSPGTISNLSMILANSDFIASSTVIYKVGNEHNLDTGTTLLPLLSLTNNSLNMDLDETMQPQTSIEISNSNNFLNATLTDNTQTERIDIRTGQEQQKSILSQPNHSESDNDGVAFLRHMNNTEANIIENEPSTSKNDKVLTRKRQRNESEWSRNKNKLLKNSGNAYEGYNSKKKYSQKSVGPVCECKMNCGGKFSLTQRQVLFDSFYRLSNRENQWLYIRRHVKIEQIKRMTLERKNNRTQTIRYFFPLDGEEVAVCKKFFVNTLNIGETMIYTAIEKAKSDECLEDNRGKHTNRPRKMSSDTESSIITNIKLFPTLPTRH